MPRLPFLIIADDLTGAAEIAALGHARGLAAAVATEDKAVFPAGADLVVFDTDSRLDGPARAAQKISALARALAPRPRGLIYKKTDSVLRGPVRAELEALARGLGFPRILLVPANPALGRTVQNGRCAIAGAPLHQTAFARDPHHPATTDAVRDLLGDAGDFPVATLGPADPLPAAGLIVGDAATGADLAAWARRVTPELLPAGGAEFFAALLHARGLTPAPHPGETNPEPPVLVISGTLSPAGANLRARARQARVPLVSLPANALADSAAAQRAIDETHAHLTAENRALVTFDGPVSGDAQFAASLRHALARLAGELARRRAWRHLIVEGGATAAAIARALKWRDLRLTRAWAPGVASLRPRQSPACTLTLKPGSYAWPDALWQCVASPVSIHGLRTLS